ncbi:MULTISPECIES: hypothetical protein [Frankia]|jgi:acetyl-CoA acetyltransferase|nr:MULTISPECIES: hypothetical protein [Frankia]
MPRTVTLGAARTPTGKLGGGLGCAALCSGGGQGDAVTLEA